MSSTGNLLSSSYSIVEESRYYWNDEPKIYWPTKEMTNDNPIAVDLFCGLGGLSIGFAKAGFNIALGVDIHWPSVETYRHAHPTAAVVLGDITKIVSLNEATNANLLDTTLKRVVGSKNVDVLMAGIPCQGFSLANKKRSILDKRNYLFIYFIEVIKLLNPKIVIIENVSSLTTMNNGSFVHDIKEAIREEGYTVENNILNAADFGVPQNRRRVFFIGARADYSVLWPTAQKKYLKNPRTVGDAISDLPSIQAGEFKDEYSSSSNLTEYQTMFRGNCNVLKNHIAPKHPKQTIEKIRSTKPGEPMYKSYKQRIRLHWDHPSPTQVSGGIRPQFQFGHPEDSRGLTVRERCRIQSIPDSVEIFGGVVQGRVQTGNAVPPLLAQALAKVINISLRIPRVQENITGWYKENLRKFPWRRDDVSAYEILISEFLLRKTRAETVAKIYPDFIQQYPSVYELAKADVKDMQKKLEILGLSNIKSEALVNLGKIVIQRFFGNIPNTPNKLVEIPHVGRYISNATVSFGYNIKQPLVDSNIQRFFNRVFDLNMEKEIHKADHLWALSDKLIPETNCKDFGWGLLDFTAMVCSPKMPNCDNCPLTSLCEYRRNIDSR